MRNVGIALGLMLSATAWAGTSPWQKYLPLKKGNSWEYKRLGGTSTAKISESVGTWHRITSLSTIGKGWLHWKGGTLYTKNHLGEVAAFYRFSEKVGTSYKPYEPNSPLSLIVTVGSKNETVTVPAGTFTNCVRFDFKTPGLFDAGLSGQWFAPGVGLVQESYVSIAGAMYSALVKAKVNGMWIPAPSKVKGMLLPVGSFGMVPSGGQPKEHSIKLTYIVKNESSKTVGWGFSSGCQFDVEIRDASGKAKYALSQNQMCTMALSSFSLAPGQKKAFPMTLTPTLPGGTYTIRAFLTPSGGLNQEKAEAKAILKIYVGGVPIGKATPN